MFIGKKAQSTAEYAIVIGLVVAVAAGVMQQMLKSGMRQKNKEAVNLLLSAGGTTLTGAADQTNKIYSEEWRKTEVTESIDESAMKKGGAEEKRQKQTASTSSVSLELLTPAN